ncbi:MAG: hypothetical protein NC311_07580 [Muribaculaceae bacterium]|nr:hypothetical protein [Muribaculaceae bacterium]
MKEEKDDLLSALLEEILTNHTDGSLISHEWLRKKSGLETPAIGDYANTEEFLEAYQANQFAYMQIVDAIRWELLKSDNIYLKNVRGDGYVILNSNDQVQFGYDRFTDGLAKLIKETNLIMNNVRAVSSEQQSKDNDLRAKYAAMRMMLESVKR